MNRQLSSLVVAVALTVAIALISGGRWPHYLMGAGFTLSLFIVLLFSTYGQAGAGKDVLTWPSWTDFALAAVVTVAVGYVLLRWIGDRDNGAWWGVAIILAAAITWPVTHRSLFGSTASNGD